MSLHKGVMILRAARASERLNAFPFQTPMTQMLKRTALSLSSTGVLAMSMISSAFAQEFAGPTPDVAGLPDASSEDELRTVITDILAGVLNFLALIAVVVVVIAGIRLIVSQGEDDAKDKAKKTIFYALIGLAVVLFARVIVGLVTVYLAEQV
jgi:hypothetical protein